MHIPIIALGLTRSTVDIVNSMLREYTADEVEFFASYTSHLNHNSPPSIDFRQPSIDSILKYSTGVEPDENL